MELTKHLYDQYKNSKSSFREDIQFDMIKRIEDYRRNIDLYNSFGLNSKSNTNISSQTSIPLQQS